MMGLLAWVTRWTTPAPQLGRAEAPALPPPSPDDLSWFASRIKHWQGWARAHPPLSAEERDRLEAARDRHNVRAELDTIAHAMVYNGGWYVPAPGASGGTWDAVERFVVEFQAANAVFEQQRALSDWPAAARSRQPESEWRHAPRWRATPEDPHRREGAD